MNLETQIAVAGVRAQIAALTKPTLLQTDAERELLAAKNAELATLLPDPPPEFPMNEPYLRSPLADYEENVERLTRKAKLLLEQRERESDPARISRLECEPLLIRLREAEGLLRDKHKVIEWQLWKSRDEEKRRERQQAAQ